MGVEIENPPVIPEIVMNKVFLLEMRIEQPRQYDEGKPPIYTVYLSYQLYGVDADGQRKFDGQVREVRIENYISHAMDKAAFGKLGLIQAFMGNEAAIAEIVADDLKTAAVVTKTASIAT